MPKASFARGPVVGHLLVEDELGYGRGVLTTVLLGPAHGEPAAVGELAAHGSGHVQVFVRRLDEPVTPLARQLGLEEVCEALLGRSFSSLVNLYCMGCSYFVILAAEPEVYLANIGSDTVSSDLLTGVQFEMANFE